MQLAKNRLAGFTLAELLIALMILGVISTFAIPKIITTQQMMANNAKAKEVIATISGAYQAAQSNGIITGSSKATDLLPYMNYLSIDTSSQIDWPVGTSGPATCSGTDKCLNLHGVGN
jgi:prepilin-type N-terminal cleavage/methylation domain-containing protein